MTLETPSQPGAAPCPAVLFGTGGLNFDLPLLAVFNSRKPRLISPDSNWLKALRFFFRSLDPRGIALAGSTGTLTYDLAGAHAMRSGLPQLLVAPFPVLQADRELSKIYGESASGIPVLSCMLDAVTCSKKQAPSCRDRILGALAIFISCWKSGLAETSWRSWRKSRQNHPGPSSFSNPKRPTLRTQEIAPF